MNLKDAAVIGGDARRARDEFGFQRMWSIYPDQIAPIVEAMQPELQEVADAGDILIAAQDASWGPIQFKGELQDRATYRYFWTLAREGPCDRHGAAGAGPAALLRLTPGDLP